MDCEMTPKHLSFPLSAASSEVGRRVFWHEQLSSTQQAGEGIHVPSSPLTPDLGNQ